MKSLNQCNHLQDYSLNIKLLYYLDTHTMLMMLSSHDLYNMVHSYHFVLRHTTTTLIVVHFAKQHLTNLDGFEKPHPVHLQQDNLHQMHTYY